MYGQLLAVRDAQQDAFLVAAETLRVQTNLPPDLRASASRTKASVLFQKAAKLFESLTISLEGPWPVSTFDETLQATTTACEAYAQALAESADPDLCRLVEPHCPEWPAAVSAVQRAHAEVLKLRAELRFRQIKWYSRQAELARVVSEAAHGRRSSDEASRAVDSLQIAGLAPTVQEQELWQLAANACDQLVAECTQIKLADSSSPSEATDSSSLTNVKSSIHEIVFHNGVQHADIVSGEALSAEVLVVAKSGAVCVPDVVMNVDSSHLDHVTKLVHLIHALAAQEP